MRIACPCCGIRDAGEFSYLGDAEPARPRASDVPIEEMLAYVYERSNPSGRHRELWYHGFGCRSWLVVTRDTRTHAIADVALARESAQPRAEEVTP